MSLGGAGTLSTPADPIDDIVVDFLFAKRRETAELDFKWTIDMARKSAFPELAKDLFAMANNGGGHILFGFQEDKKTGAITPIGLPPEFHVDQADLQGKFNAFTTEQVTLHYREFERTIDGSKRRFALLHVPAPTCVLAPRVEGKYAYDGGRERVVFRAGDVLVRHGTRSELATPDDVKAIERRAKMTGYRMSLLSGQPEEIQEQLTSDLFEVTRLPTHVWSAALKSREVAFEVLRQTDYLLRDQRLYCFDDPTGSGFAKYIKPGTAQRFTRESWLASEDHVRIFASMLDLIVQRHARTHGLHLQREGRKLFYPLRDGEEKRQASWPGLARPSSRQVAKKLTIPKLGATVGVHSAVQVKFVRLGGDYFLRIIPNIVLTTDGRSPLVGPQAGAVITSLGASNYNFNAAHVRNILFWLAQFNPKDGRIRFGGHIEAKARPLTTTIQVGIRADRPMNIERVVELDSEEREDTPEAG